MTCSARSFHRVRYHAASEVARPSLHAPSPRLSRVRGGKRRRQQGAIIEAGCFNFGRSNPSRNMKKAFQIAVDVQDLIDSIVPKLSMFQPFLSVPRQPRRRFARIWRGDRAACNLQLRFKRQQQAQGICLKLASQCSCLKAASRDRKTCAGIR